MSKEKTTGAEPKMTFKEVWDHIIDVYVKNPTPDNLELAMALCVDVDESELPKLVELLEKNGDHNLTGKELTKQIDELRKLANGLMDGRYPLPIAERMLGERAYITTIGDEKLRRYSKGVFAEDKNCEIDNDIIDIIGQAVKPSQVDNVKDLMSRRTMTSTPTHTEWINFANGRYDIATRRLIPHYADDFIEIPDAHKSIIQCPVQYIPDATCELFLELLEDKLPDRSDRELLLQSFGYALLQDVRYGKIFIYYGPTHTGKSTFLHILKCLLGVHNTAALTLLDIDDARKDFMASYMHHKLANISPDAPNDMLPGGSRIKAIASGDAVTMQLKHKPLFTDTLFSTIFSSSNFMPVSVDTSEAWTQRLIFLEFKEQHLDNVKPRLVKELTTQQALSGILNYTLDALHRLLDNDGFIMTENRKRMQELYMIHNDSCYQFLKIHCEVGDGKITEGKLYKAYIDWAKDLGIEQEHRRNMADFRSAVDRFSAGKVDYKQGDSRENRAYEFRGIHMLQDKELKKHRMERKRELAQKRERNNKHKQGEPAYDDDGIDL